MSATTMRMPVAVAEQHTREENTIVNDLNSAMETSDTNNQKQHDENDNDRRSISSSSSSSSMSTSVRSLRGSESESDSEGSCSDNNDDDDEEQEDIRRLEDLDRHRHTLTTTNTMESHDKTDMIDKSSLNNHPSSFLTNTLNSLKDENEEMLADLQCLGAENEDLLKELEVMRRAHEQLHDAHDALLHSTSGMVTSVAATSCTATPAAAPTIPAPISAPAPTPAPSSLTKTEQEYERIIGGLRRELQRRGRKWNLERASLQEEIAALKKKEISFDENDKDVVAVSPKEEEESDDPFATVRSNTGTSTPVYCAACAARIPTTDSDNIEGEQDHNASAEDSTYIKPSASCGSMTSASTSSSHKNGQAETTPTPTPYTFLGSASNWLWKKEESQVEVESDNEYDTEKEVIDMWTSVLGNDRDDPVVAWKQCLPTSENENEVEAEVVTKP